MELLVYIYILTHTIIMWHTYPCRLDLLEIIEQVLHFPENMYNANQWNQNIFPDGWLVWMVNASRRYTAWTVSKKKHTSYICEQQDTTYRSLANSHIFFIFDMGSTILVTISSKSFEAKQGIKLSQALALQPILWPVCYTPILLPQCWLPFEFYL